MQKVLDNPVLAVKKSRFWATLWNAYSEVPSVAFCRIPELEYAATLSVDGQVLDHCCGDGLFASMAWGNRKISAGCDINQAAVDLAIKRGIYNAVDRCDASKHLPYKDATFDLVFNNSGLEHIKDVDAALGEISRVLKPGGAFAFNILNHRYFEWWPLSNEAKHDYISWQCFYHALPLKEWEKHLGDAHLKIKSVSGYFDEKSSRMLAWLDYHFSGYYLAHRRTWPCKAQRVMPSIMMAYWKMRLSSLKWDAQPDSGAGYFIQAVRDI